MFTPKMSTPKMNISEMSIILGVDSFGKKHFSTYPLKSQFMYFMIANYCQLIHWMYIYYYISQ